jgi:hypothetical protein
VRHPEELVRALADDRVGEDEDDAHRDEDQHARCSLKHKITKKKKHY